MASDSSKLDSSMRSIQFGGSQYGGSQFGGISQYGGSQTGGVSQYGGSQTGESQFGGMSHMQSLYTSIGNLSIGDLNDGEEHASDELRGVEPENTTVERLTRLDTKQVRYWRIVILVLILAAGGALTSFIYFAFQEKEQDDKTAAVSKSNWYVAYVLNEQA